jgi:hypothetical protein
MTRSSPAMKNPQVYVMVAFLGFRTIHTLYTFPTCQLHDPLKSDSDEWWYLGLAGYSGGLGQKILQWVLSEWAQV